MARSQEQRPQADAAATFSAAATNPTDGKTPVDVLPHRFGYMQWAPEILDLQSSLIKNANRAALFNVAKTIRIATQPDLHEGHKLDMYRRLNALPATEKHVSDRNMVELGHALALVRTGELLLEKPDEITVTLDAGNHDHLYKTVMVAKTLIEGSDRTPLPPSLAQQVRSIMPEFGLQVRFDVAEIPDQPGYFEATARVSRLPEEERRKRIKVAPGTDGGGN